jgi:hypothetical protein
MYRETITNTTELFRDLEDRIRALELSKNQVRVPSIRIGDLILEQLEPISAPNGVRTLTIRNVKGTNTPVTVIVVP